MGATSSTRRTNKPKSHWMFPRNYPKPVVTKCVPKLAQQGAKDIDDTRRQLYSLLLAMPSHPNMMRVYDVREKSNSFMVVMEKMEGGELFDFLVSPSCQTISESACKHLTRQLLLGLLHLHKHGILHRDLKPENVMFRYKAKKAKTIEQRYEIALIDFDSCKPMVSADEESGSMRRLVGTPAYMAPEVLIGGHPTEASDLWAVGILLYVMLMGSPPLKMHQMTTPKKAWAIVRQVEKTGFDFSCARMAVSEEAVDLCRALLEFDPKNRLQTAASSLSHPWLREDSVMIFEGEFCSTDSSLDATECFSDPTDTGSCNDGISFSGYEQNDGTTVVDVSAPTSTPTPTLEFPSSSFKPSTAPCAVAVTSSA